MWAFPMVTSHSNYLIRPFFFWLHISLIASFMPFILICNMLQPIHSYHALLSHSLGAPQPSLATVEVDEPLVQEKFWNH